MSNRDLFFFFWGLLFFFFFLKPQLARLARSAWLVYPEWMLAALLDSQPASQPAGREKPRLEHWWVLRRWEMGDLGMHGAAAGSTATICEGGQGSSAKVPGSWEGTWETSARGHSANLAHPGLRKLDVSPVETGKLEGELY